MPLNPAYAGWAHQITLRDATLELHPDLRLGWYIGGPHNDLQIELRRFFSSLRATLDLDRIIYIGSSGGGFASLYYSRYDDKSCAIAIEPETDARKYYYFSEFSKLAWPGIPSAGVARARALDLCARYNESFLNTVIYIQNAANQKHLKNHTLPFVMAANSGSGANLICHSDYWGSADYGTIPATVTSLWLKAALTAPSLRSGDILQAFYKAREERQSAALAAAVSAAQPDPDASTERAG